MQRAKAKFMYVAPLTLLIIIILLFINFRNIAEVATIMGTLPLAMVGSIWLMYLEGFYFSVPVGVGFIALAGVAVEIGVIMLVYLNQAYHSMLAQCHTDKSVPTLTIFSEAILQGARLRVRPVMSRIAAPMVAGMVSAVILTPLVLPAVHLLWRKHNIKSALLLKYPNQLT
jgi:Cu(I)/Ag(I) efflux system membrane protein CusA/SilA